MFRENRNFVITGIVLSMLSVAVAARPRNRDQFMSLVLGLSVMAPGVFYFCFLMMRFLDVFRSLGEGVNGILLRRAAMLCALFLPCAAAICWVASYWQGCLVGLLQLQSPSLQD